MVDMAFWKDQVRGRDYVEELVVAKMIGKKNRVIQRVISAGFSPFCRCVGCNGVFERAVMSQFEIT